VWIVLQIGRVPLAHILIAHLGRYLEIFCWPTIKKLYIKLANQRCGILDPTLQIYTQLAGLIYIFFGLEKKFFRIFMQK